MLGKRHFKCSYVKVMLLKETKIIIIESFKKSLKSIYLVDFFLKNHEKNTVLVYIGLVHIKYEIRECFYKGMHRH